MTSRTIFDNITVAARWAQGQGDSASHNRQLYNKGNVLYSYGPHYVAAYLVPGYYLPVSFVTPSRTIAVALFNTTRASLTTTRHTGLARAAFAYLPRYMGAGFDILPVNVPDLTGFLSKRLGRIGAPVGNESDQTNLANEFQRILSEHCERNAAPLPSDVAEFLKGVSA